MIAHAAQVHYDPQADVLYLISARGPVFRSIEVSPGMTIEYDQQNNILGLEILRASHVLAEKVVASLHAKQAGIM